MNEEGTIQIHQLNGNHNAWISLQGTVLTYVTRSWISETTIEIPIELISIHQKKQHKTRHLLSAMIWLGLSIIFSHQLNRMPYAYSMQPTTTIQLLFFLLSLLLTTGPVLTLLALYLIRQPAIHLIFSSPTQTISFWFRKAHQKKITNLLSAILERQQYVHEQVAFPLECSVKDTIDQPLRKTFTQLWICLLPTAITGIPELLWLGLLPLAPFVWNQLYLSEQPRLFRRALKAYLQKRWNDGLTLTNELSSRYQNYMPAKMLRIQLYMQLHQFEEAIRQLQATRGEVDSDLAQKIQQEIILRQRIFERQHLSVH